MNELVISNTQAVIFMVVLIGLLVYLNHRDHKKSAQMEQENTLVIEIPSEDITPDYVWAIYSACRSETVGVLVCLKK